MYNMHSDSDISNMLKSLTMLCCVSRMERIKSKHELQLQIIECYQLDISILYNYELFRDGTFDNMFHRVSYSCSTTYQK